MENIGSELAQKFIRDIRGAGLPTDHRILCFVAKNVQLLYLVKLMLLPGHAVAQLVEALCYKPEGRGLDSQWCHWNFSLT
jgi:hypothetical protein